MRKQEAGGAMPEIVEAGSRGDACFGEQALVVPMQGNGFQWTTAWARKDQVGPNPARTGHQPLFELMVRWAFNTRRTLSGSAITRRLRSVFTSVIVRPLPSRRCTAWQTPKDPIVQIDVCPPQA